MTVSERLAPLDPDYEAHLEAAFSDFDPATTWTLSIDDLKDLARGWKLDAIDLVGSLTPGSTV